MLTPHPEYLLLGADPVARTSACRALFAEALPDELVREIRRYLQQQKASGTNRFLAWLEARTGQPAGVRQAGRPPTPANCP